MSPRRDYEKRYLVLYETMVGRGRFGFEWQQFLESDVTSKMIREGWLSHPTRYREKLQIPPLRVKLLRSIKNFRTTKEGIPVPKDWAGFCLLYEAAIGMEQSLIPDIEKPLPPAPPAAIIVPEKIELSPPKWKDSIPVSALPTEEEDLTGYQAKRTVCDHVLDRVKERASQMNFSDSSLDREELRNKIDRAVDLSIGRGDCYPVIKNPEGYRTLVVKSPMFPGLVFIVGENRNRYGKNKPQAVVSVLTTKMEEQNRSSGYWTLL